MLLHFRLVNFLQMFCLVNPNLGALLSKLTPLPNHHRCVYHPPRESVKNVDSDAGALGDASASGPDCTLNNRPWFLG